MPILNGFAQSSYVITARATAILKGVDLEFRPVKPGDHKSPAFLATHPWGKVPTFEDGDVRLFETAAICRYLDEAYPGRALQPTSPTGRAKVAQWISVTNCYLYAHMVPPYLLKYIFAPEGGPDRNAIEAAMPVIEHDVAAIADRLGNDTFLVENTLSLADLFVAPLLMGIARFPEGRATVEKHPNLGRMVGALVETPGFLGAFPG